MFSSQLADFQSAIKKLEGPSSLLTQALEFSQNFRDAENKRFDESGPVRGRTFTLTESIIYCEQSIKTFISLKLDKNKVVALNQWQLTINSVDQMISTIGNLGSMVAAAKSDGRKLKISDGSTLVLSENSQPAFDLTEIAITLVNSSDALLNAIAFLFGASRAAVAAKTNREGKLTTDDAKAAAAALARAEQASAEARKLVETMSSSLAEAEASKSAASSNAAALLSSLQAFNTEAQNIIESIKLNASTASANANVISTRMTEIAALKSQADSTSSSLAAYDNALAATQSEVDLAIQKSKDIISEFDKQRVEVDRLIANAEAMLKGSTTSALAHAFDQERNNLDKAMGLAFWQFCVGIVLIILFSALLAIYVLDIPIVIGGINLAHPMGGGKPKGEVALAEVLSRAILIIGPFWLTRFAAARYRSLFELRQQYSHKYNMAFSVEGFQKQAPQFKEWITTWVFMIVAESPSIQSYNGSSMDAPPPISIKEIGEGIIKRAAKIFGVDLSKITLPENIEGLK